MTQAATNRFIAALKTGAGLKDEFIYYMSFSDYQSFPDPFPRTKFAVREVQETHPQIPESRKAPRAFSVGYSWPVIHTR